MQRWYIKNEQDFFLPCDKPDGPGLQKRDLSNSQMSTLLKIKLLFCALFEIIQEAR